MAGSGIQIIKRGSSGTITPSFKLIPNEVILANSDPSEFYVGTTGSVGNPGETIFQAKKGYMHICRYGWNHSPIIRIVPPDDGEEGDWFGITDGMGYGVVLGWTVLNMSKHPIQFLGGGGSQYTGSKAYFHYNGGKWILAFYYDAQEINANIPQKTVLNIASLTKTGLTGGATLTGEIEVHQTNHFVTMDLNFSLNIGTNTLGQIIVEIPFNLLPESNTGSIDFPILSKRFSDDTTGVLHLQKFSNTLIFSLNTSFLKTTTNQAVVVWGTLSYFKKL